ncbi:MAG: aldo/keto reductase [Candidatus Schekmanbacteria bacterium]|nr:aldo/keto reductase [Candidatus Schekmanbacteria bacterium]
MKYKTLGNSGLHVSAIGLGTWAIGGMFWGKSDDKQSIGAITASIEAGINLIDTAPAYGDGHSEIVVGKAIKGKRDKVIIATKCGIDTRKGFAFNLKPARVREEAEASLKRLGIDCIDIYQCHWPDPKTPIEETLEMMMKLKTEGKIRHIGVSNFEVPLLQEAVKAAPIVSLQSHYSLLERSIEKEIIPFCRENNIGILTYGSLASGILTGKYDKQPKFSAGDARNFFYPFYKEPLWSKAQALISELKKIADEHGKPVSHVALNWLTQKAEVSSALVGAKNKEQAINNAESCDWELGEAELKSIENAYRRIFAEG